MLTWIELYDHHQITRSAMSKKIKPIKIFPNKTKEKKEEKNDSKED